jgi:tetratricopeptide (TPR) repeat protein
MNTILRFFIYIIISLGMVRAQYTLSEIEGNVRVNDANRSFKASSGMHVSAQAVIRVFKGARCTVTAPDNTRHVLNSDTITPLHILKKNNGSSEVSSILLRLRGDGIVSQSGHAQVAGVRGAEQGKRGQFGVQWQSENSDEDAAIDAYKKGIIFYEKGYFERALASFKRSLRLSKEGHTMNTSRYYHMRSQLELLDYNGALSDISLLQEVDDSELDTRALSYYAALCKYYQGKLKEAEEYISRFADENNGHQLYWPGKLLQLIIANKNGENKLAKAIRDDIILNCKDQDIHTSVMALDM